MPSVSEDAICLRQWDWSETSQTVSLFTRGQGLVRAIAKGSRRPRAPFSGGLESLTRGEAEVILKPEGKLSNLIAWDLRDPYLPLRQSLAAMRAGVYTLDLVGQSVSPNDPHPRLFDGLVRALTSLTDERVGGAASLLAFHRLVLAESGLTPRLDHPPVTGDAIWHFDPEASCLSTSSGGVERWAIRAKTVLALTGEDESPSEASVERANRFCVAYLERKLDVELPSARFVFGLVPHRR